MLRFSWVILEFFSADDFCESLRILFIIAVTGHRCKPRSCTFEASNAEYGIYPYSA